MKEPNWKKMYAILCGGISAALDALALHPENEKICLILRSVLEEAEELYLRDTE